MTKKKKGIIIAVVAVIVAAAVGCGLYFGIGPGSSRTVDTEVADGELYRTKLESFWAGVGKAYISFQHKEEPENKEADDTELYGDVFYVMVSSGEGFDPWLQGNYNLDEENGKLMLTAEWDTSAENYTALANAQPGEEKIYTAENGEFKIPVELPGSAKVTFKFNPKTDKVGELTPAVEDDNTAKDNTAKDENKNENTGNLFARLEAEDSLFNGEVKGYAQIDMIKDGTWAMKVKVEPYVPDYTQAVNGKWVENADGSLTLTVSSGDYKDSLAQTFDFKKGSDGVYTGSVEFTADKGNGIVFNFNFHSVDISDLTADSSSSQTSSSDKASSGSKPASVAKGEIYRTPVYHGIYSGIVGDAYITFLDVDTVHSEIKLKGKIFGVYVDAGDGYTPWISGYWSLNVDNTKLTLTQKGKSEAGLTGAVTDKGKVYTAKDGVFMIDAYFPSGGKATFTFKPTRDKVGSANTSSSNKPQNPSTTEKPVEAGDIVLNATDSIYDGAVTCKSVLTVKKDGTWNMSADVYGNHIASAASGTWEENTDKSLTLKTTQKHELAQLDNQFTLKFDPVSATYSGTVKLICNGQFTFNLNFVSGGTVEEDPTPSPTPDPDPTPLPGSENELYRTPVYRGIYSGVVGNAYISFLDTNEFNVYVDAGDGYDVWFNGTWSLSGDKTKLTLTQEEIGDAGLKDAQPGVGKVYTAKDGEFTIEAFFPSGGKAKFKFNPERDATQANTPESGTEIYRTPVFHGIYWGFVGDAYISFLDTGRFDIYVDMGLGYRSRINGTWSMNSEKTELTLTQKTSGLSGLKGAKSGVGKVYKSDNGTFTINAHFPICGTAVFTFNPATDAA